MIFPTSDKILDFNELFEDITYDWPLGYSDKSMIRKESGNKLSFHINKTDIFEDGGKFYKSYKTECNEITKEAFEKTELLYQLLYGKVE